MLSHNTRAGWRVSNPSRWLKIFSFAILAFVISSSAALAQTADTQSSGDAAAPAGGRQMPTVDEQLQKLTKALTLTDDQQTKIKPSLKVSVPRWKPSATTPPATAAKTSPRCATFTKRP